MRHAIKRVEIQLSRHHYLLSSRPSLGGYIFPDHRDVDTSTLVCSVNKLNKAPLRLSLCIVQYTPDSNDTGMALESHVTWESST